MNGIAARAYVLATMADDQIQDLHRVELKIGYCLPGGAIHDRYSTPKYGSIDSAAAERTQAVVMAIFKRVEGEYRAKHAESWIFDTVKIQHLVDFQIKRQGVTMETGNQQVSSLRETIRKSQPRRLQASGILPV